ncbi:Glucomannan 4-beta-mannosyltransferase 1 [Acorus gramineus]|uniref:glucomannan 4-beta-mannosyltransferase n=1 Tax=Acorus gramineus TaxID=55184 RepID=A0AAV9A8K8_ACOGR|nr:Glucomannan 4-beta-mannosyltransferase 1 [Acorus gramineus]
MKTNVFQFILLLASVATTSADQITHTSSDTPPPLRAFEFYFDEVRTALRWFGSTWRTVRVKAVVPVFEITIWVCLLMSVMILGEKLMVGGVSLFVKVLGLRPEKRYKWEPISGGDAEIGHSAYPMVLVQIPMYNEKEVYKLSIGAACGLSWPSDRMIIQVLDDSTDPVVKEMVESEVTRWSRKGMNINYEVRDNRKGYKAGALREGMKHEYVRLCDYVAIFDADFQPEPDFLIRMIPFLVYNSDVALVQARWKFVNANECLMTRIQEMSLDYHFKVEQEAGSSTFAFFGFNGTAGVWRIVALNEAGGWKDRTTVEDMDLAVRASLGGWKFVYVGDVMVKSELPSTFKAYRFQQHRWSCGPANLFKKMAMEIVKAGKVSIWKKLYMIYSFFFVGKIAAHTVTFTFYCVLIPASVWIPEVEIPQWGVVYVPLAITLCKAVGTPSSIHLIVFWILFENVMSLHRIKAAIIGLLEVGRVNEWIVTEKLGDTLKSKTENTVEEVKISISGDTDIAKPLIDGSAKEVTKKPQNGWWSRLNFWELCVGFFIMCCGLYDVLYVKKGYYVYLFLQSTAFLVAGVGYVGTFVA